MNNSTEHMLTEMMVTAATAVSTAVVGPSLVQAHDRAFARSVADEFTTVHDRASEPEPGAVGR